MKKILFSVAALIIVSLSVNSIVNAKPEKCLKGSGNVSEETRNVSGFAKLDAHGGLEVKIIKSDKFSVKVKADDNLIQHITSEVKGNTLVLKTNKSICTSKSLEVTVYMPELTALTTSGAVEITSEQLFETEKFDLNLKGASEVKLNINCKLMVSKLSGASELRLKGTVDTHALTMTGASDVKAEDLKVSKYAIESRGASECKIYVTDELSVSASGASNIKYKGVPGKVTKDITGASALSEF